MSTIRPPRRPWIRRIGILGGLGPHAHVELEHRLLAAVDAAVDQDYPDWVVVSIPSTPDRTAAIRGAGESPVAALADGLGRLQRAGADFAVVPCLTAHAFLAAASSKAGLPVLSLVALTVEAVARRPGPPSRVGLLATDGTLASGLFPAAWLTPLDLSDGATVQEEEVMRPIYGARSQGKRVGAQHGGQRGGGIKGRETHDPETGREHRQVLRSAARRLAADGAEVVVAGCTEISLALGPELEDGTPVVDPLDVAVAAALELAAGRRPLGPLCYDGIC